MSRPPHKKSLKVDECPLLAQNAFPDYYMAVV
jgi:hypothetical protein